MILLGFDLSLSNSGWAVGKVEGGVLTVVDYGSIGTKRFSKRSTGFRLHHIAKELKELYKKYPTATKVIKERSFSNARITASQQIQKVNGVWELFSHLAGHEDFTEIAPTSVKKLVTENGKASKKEVADAVRELTGIETKVEDESDAIAVLIAYCRKEGLIDG